jgi:hypothetical protein
LRSARNEEETTAMRTTAEKHGKTSKSTRAVEVGGIGSPISNEAYDVIAALHAKLEGLEAYRKYANDGNVGLWKQLTNTEIEAVSTLVDELERIVKAGKLRMNEPGDTKH